MGGDGVQLQAAAMPHVYRRIGGLGVGGLGKSRLASRCGYVCHTCMDGSAQNRAASCAAAARPAARDPHCADRVRQATAFSAQARASRVSVSSNREKTTTLASQGERPCLCACTRRARSSRTADSTRAPAVPCRGSDRIRLVRGAQPPPGGRAADRGGLQWVMRKPPTSRSRAPHVPPPGIGAQQRARCAAQRRVRADWSMRVESLAVQNTSEYAWPQGVRMSASCG